MRAAASTTAPVQAVQDLGCLDRVKFRYTLPHSLTDALLDAFPGAEARRMPFSRLAYGPIHMTTGENADCANCVTRFAKKCRGLTQAHAAPP